MRNGNTSDNPFELARALIATYNDHRAVHGIDADEHDELVAQQIGAFIAMVAGQHKSLNRVAMTDSINTVAGGALKHAQRLVIAMERLPSDNVLDLAEYAYRRGKSQ